MLGSLDLATHQTPAAQASGKTCQGMKALARLFMDHVEQIPDRRESPRDKIAEDASRQLAHGQR